MVSNRNSNRNYTNPKTKSWFQFFKLEWNFKSLHLIDPSQGFKLARAQFQKLYQFVILNFRHPPKCNEKNIFVKSKIVNLCLKSLFSIYNYQLCSKLRQTNNITLLKYHWIDITKWPKFTKNNEHVFGRKLPLFDSLFLWPFDSKMSNLVKNDLSAFGKYAFRCLMILPNGLNKSLFLKISNCSILMKF